MKKIRTLTCVLVFLFSAAAAVSSQSSDRKNALVIGNADYKSVGVLRNPLNDANDVSEALAELGFTVIKRLNGTHAQMVDDVRRFGAELAKGGAGLFYYSGHGVQAGGVNYLIPVDADIRAEHELQSFAVSLELVLGYMKQAGNGFNMVVLDACRDNPFKGLRDMQKGLAVVAAPKGTIVAYATGPDQTADDGEGRNAPFTAVLIRNVKTPGLEVLQLLKMVGEEVAQETGNQQVPWVHFSPYGEYYLAGKAGIPSSEAPQQPRITLEQVYGSVRVEARTGGRLYLDGKEFTDLPAGQAAKIDNLTVGAHELEMRYADGETEKRSAVIEKNILAAVAFNYFEHPTVPPNMVSVDGGTFRMGSDYGDSDEKPVHTVTVSGFLISKYEVTFDEYDAFCEATGKSKPSDAGWGRGKRPVIDVSWDDSVEYCNWLSQKEGRDPCYAISGTNVSCDFSKNGYRLPTEAEWEYAARGGNLSRGYMYAGGNSPDGVAWYDSNSGEQTHPVGKKVPNELGLYDMSGNVWEWCWDWYGDYGSAAQTDPRGPSSGYRRGLRGGSWYYWPLSPRATDRYDFLPGGMSYHGGFRVAASR